MTWCIPRLIGHRCKNEANCTAPPSMLRSGLHDQQEQLVKQSTHTFASLLIDRTEPIDSFFLLQLEFTILSWFLDKTIRFSINT